MQSILVLNCGSSSIKFALFGNRAGNTCEDTPFLSGNASRLNDPARAVMALTYGGESRTLSLPGGGHQAALDAIGDMLRQYGLLQAIGAVGHRVVHGGDRFRSPTRIDADALAGIESCSAYAPLHNPANLLGIRALMALLPQRPQIAIFDTAFHGSLPPVAYRYGVPTAWYREHGVRRYGFHGISHAYIASALPGLLNCSPDEVRAVSAHLGNGCSLCAIRGGKSIDTSMGFTPLEGLMMGSRSGDLDPGLHEYLTQALGVDLQTLTQHLNRDAGLKGVSGVSNDMRACLQAAAEGHTDAQLAVELFCYRLAKAIAAYVVPLGRIDTLAFTGGIGENAAPIRARVIEHLQGLGFTLDAVANEHGEAPPRNIAAPDSPPVWIIPAREEWVIAHQTAELISATGSHR